MGFKGVATILRELDEHEQAKLDKGEVAHYVISPNDDETNHAYVMRARIEGFPVEALCGYIWVPNKQATGLPVCPECEELSKNYDAGDGGDPKE